MTSSSASVPETGLLFVDSERCADMLYATGVIVPDPFLWIAGPSETVVVVSSMEANRVRTSLGQTATVLTRTEAAERLGLSTSPLPKSADVAVALLQKAGTPACRVPPDFPLHFAEALRERGIEVRTRSPFFPERANKETEEIERIREGVRLAERGLDRALTILREARIRDDGTLAWKPMDDQPLSSEILRGEINAEIARRGGTASHTIVAPGPQGADPHQVGTGPIRRDQPVVIDIFPRVDASGYHGDLTRTVVKGRAARVVRNAYAAVAGAQEAAIAAAGPNVPVRDVHRAATDAIEQAGFKTDLRASPPHGFIHGTGHGLGLEVHEAPRVSDADGLLESGNVVTIEPGVYFPAWGGLRLEDVIAITDQGNENLTTAERLLEIP